MFDMGLFPDFRKSRKGIVKIYMHRIVFQSTVSL